jgi:hypothetical protein
MTYKEREDTDDEPVADAPVSPWLKVVRRGDLPEDDEEAIEWAEIQRLVSEQMWGPILALPASRDDFFLRGDWEDGVDISAFNTHDFARSSGHSYRYGRAMNRARQEYREALWMYEMVRDQLDNPAKYTVLMYLEKGVIDVEHCVGSMRHLAIVRARCVAAAAEMDRIRKAWARARRG